VPGYGASSTLWYDDTHRSIVMIADLVVVVSIHLTWANPIVDRTRTVCLERLVVLEVGIVVVVVDHRIVVIAHCSDD
jgi:hypothetical protein